MRVSLATSLHLNHGVMSPLADGTGPVPMQAFVPVGLLSLKAMVDAQVDGAEVRVVEVNGLLNTGAIANDDGFYDNVVDSIFEPDDALVGLMTDADSLHHTVRIAERIRARSPDVRICLGGPGSSPISRELISTFPAIDFIIRGEGELSFAGLLRAIADGRPLHDVAGLTWRHEDTAVENPRMLVVDDCDDLPVPSFDAYDMLSNAPLYLDVGRGCPFRCQFCSTAPFWERKYRMKSVDRILREMMLVRDRFGRHHVNFSHDIFTYDRDWTREFCATLADSALGVEWTCSTRTDVIDEDLLERMAVAGCVEIYYGIESGSPNLQKEIRKNLDLDRAASIVEATDRVGIRAVTGLIVGYPSETPETLDDTFGAFFDFLRRGATRAHLFALCPFHESPLYARFGATARRRANYFDLPLAPAVVRQADALLDREPALFASAFRYDTPQIDHRLVDASEEVSAHLVVLRSVWPHILPLYASSLEFFSRWTGWIEEVNRSRRPDCRLVHFGDARDMVDFLEAELLRMGVSNSGANEVIRYESMKLRARSLEVRRSSRRGQAGSALGPNSRVERACEFLAAPFGSNIFSLLASGAEGGATDANDEVWVLFVARDDESVDTFVTSCAAVEVLRASDSGKSVARVVMEALPTTASPDDPQYFEGLRIVEQFVSLGMLAEVH